MKIDFASEIVEINFVMSNRPVNVNLKVKNNHQPTFRLPPIRRVVNKLKYYTIFIILYYISLLDSTPVTQNVDGFTNIK